MIQYISHQNERYGQLEGIEMALKGGCRWVQLRMKNASEEEFLQTALKAAALCKEYGATFILDDKVEMVQRCGADGVHLGKKDMPVAEARKILGDKIIGGTANTFEDICNLVGSGVDYIGCGPFRFTTTKQGLSPIIGLEGYAQIAEKMQVHGISVPIVAIGGITSSDINDIASAGPFGIALSGAVLGAEDPIKEMQKIIEIYGKVNNCRKGI